MAKPLSSKIQKKIRKGARSVTDSIQNLTPGRHRGPSTTTTVAKVAGVAAAGAAGVAAAAHYLRRGSRNAVTLHVKANSDGWVIQAEGDDEPLAAFETKREAVRAARQHADRVAPSELVIHKTDGTVAQSHSYQP